MVHYQSNIISYQDYLNFKKETAHPQYQWVQSVLLFIFPYSQESHQTDHYLPAKFAYGQDYHQVIKQKLIEIAESMKLSRYEALVDLSFLDEKAAAVMAGLGEIGRNNLLLTPEFGSRVFIGEIVTDAKLETKETKKEWIPSHSCINCNLCVIHCPTKALDQGFTRSKCLSYLSQKESKEYSLYDHMKLYYGCDVCQDVCPVNYKRYESLPEFEYCEDSSLKLEDIINLSNQEFTQKYQNKTFHWMPVKRMVRNLLILAANQGKLTEKEVEFFQKKFYNIPWLVDHLTYLKGRIKRGNY